MAKKIAKEEMIVDQTTIRDYELVLILPPTASEKGEETLATIKKWLGKDGQIADVQSWGKRPLAYPIAKQTEGIYLFANIAMMPGSLQNLSNKMRMEDTILRHIFLLKKVKKEKLSTKEKGKESSPPKDVKK